MTFTPFVWLMVLFLLVDVGLYFFPERLTTKRPFVIAASGLIFLTVATGVALWLS